MILILECINKTTRKKVYAINNKKNKTIIFLKQNKKIKINTS